MDSRKPFLIGLGLFGLVLIAAVILTQRSFKGHAENYDQALAQTTAWENRMGDLLSIRGQVNGVVESVSEKKMASIESAISNLPTSSDSRLNTGIENMALAAMKTADSLVRKDAAAAQRHAQDVTAISASLNPVFTELEQQLKQGRQDSESARLNAFAGMARGEGIEMSIFLAFGLTFMALCAMGINRLVEWLRRQPHPAVVVAPRRLSASRGISVVELLMVVAITLVLSTIAIANIAAVVSSTRVRAGISSVSGLFQNTRMLAVKKNKTMTSHMVTLSRGTLVGYVKEATDSSELSSADTQVEWEAPVIRLAEPVGEGAPDDLDSDALGFTPQTGDISFNTRGLPCIYSGGNCTNSGFLYYFKDTSRQGGKGWAALSVSPAGKVKKWFWNGSRWSD